MSKTLKSQKMNKIMYIFIGCTIIGIILLITISKVLNNNKNTNLQTGENNNSTPSSIEEASSSIGKKVDEVKESNENKNNETIQVQLEDSTQNTVSEITNNEIDLNTSKVNNTENLNKQENTSNNSEEQLTQAQENTEATKDPVFSMPVDGEVVKKYGKDKLIYSNTLKEWTTHLGIDIKADKTTIVKASSEGTVKSIKNDPRYGLTVVIEHENEFTTVYSNLLTAEFVVAGENVKAGQTIGTVGNSATFEIVDDPHLHFEILKSGDSVDPEMYIK